MKESVKSVKSKWEAYYFTSMKIWYSLPENTMKLEELTFLKLKKIHRFYFRMNKEIYESGHHPTVRQKSER